MVLEGDVLQIVQALTKDGRNWSKYGYLIEDTHGILNSMQKLQVIHVSCNLNSAIHRLAREALSLCEEQCFIEEVPPYIYDIISVEHNA